MASFAEFAKPVLFPRDPTDLTSTAQCPACFARLKGTICSRCRLDLGHPLAAELAEASTDAAASLRRRLELIGQIRFETSESKVPVVMPGPAAVVAPPTRQAPPAPPPLPPLATEPAGPTRSSVQVILLIVGVSLLSIAAIFFLVYAFINFGIVWRSVIIGSITVAALAASSILRRRQLTATAEGVAVFAVVLVYLDAFALRANDLFGAAAADPNVYWGATLVVSAVVFAAWHRLSALRVSSVAAFAAVAPGAGLLTAGLLDSSDPGTTATVGFAVTAIVGLLHPVSALVLEKSILLGVAFIAWLLAFVFSFGVQPNNPWAATVALLGLAAIALAHVVVASRSESRSVSAWGRAFTAAGAVALAVSVGAGTLRGTEIPAMLFVPTVVAAAIALGFDLLRGRMPRALPSSSARIASRSAAAVAGVALMPALFVAIGTSAFAAARPLIGGVEFEIADAVAEITDEVRASIFAVGSVVVLAALAAFVPGASAMRRRALLWAVGAALILSIPLFMTLGLVVAGWYVLAAVVLAILLLQRALPRWVRIPLATTAAASATLAYATGWASEGTWLVSSGVAIALLLAARALVPPTTRAILLGVAALVALIASGALADQLGSTSDIPRFVGLLAVLMLIASTVSRVGADLDRRLLFWIGGITAAFTAVAGNQSPSGLVLTQQGANLAIGLCLTGALIAWSTKSLTVERTAAAVGIAPALFVASLGIPLPTDLEPLVGITVSLLVAAAGLAVSITLPRWMPRLASDAGAVVVAVPAVYVPVAASDRLDWLVLGLAAATVLMLAIARDGLIASASRRKHLGWVALALATLALWTRLDAANLTAIEFYVVPLGLVLLAVAYLVWRADASSRAAAPITLGGLATILVPIAVVASGGSLARAIMIASVSGLLIAIGSVVIGSVVIGSVVIGSIAIAPAAARPFLDVAALAGVAGLLTVSVGRLATTSMSSGAYDSWVAAAAAGLAIVAWGQSRAIDPRRRRVAEIVTNLAFVGVFCFEALAFSETALGSARAIVVILALSAAPVIAASRWRSVTWIAIALAGASGFVGLASGALEQLEWATIPIGVSLLVSGSIRLSRTSTVTSWPTLAPGLIVLLAPSLVATIDDRPAWRLVGIGVVAVAAIIVGAIRRLQAPFVIGAIVALAHGIATFAPGIRAVYLALPWWLWAGIGGIVLIALAARYEHRMRNLRSAVGRLGALR